PGPCENASHGPEAGVTEKLLELKPKPRNRAIPFFVAMAACLLLATGAAFLLVHRAMKPTVVATNPPVDTRPLPGRAPTPMELWMASPRGQKRLQKLASQAPRVDPAKAALA